jgi:hypothetical protein
MGDGTQIRGKQMGKKWWSFSKRLTWRKWEVEAYFRPGWVFILGAWWGEFGGSAGFNLAGLLVEVRYTDWRTAGTVTQPKGGAS